MLVTLNGNLATLPDPSTVAAAIEHLRSIRGDGAAPGARIPCAVEVNKRLVPHREHAAAELRDGDQIEIVTLVGGG